MKLCIRKSDRTIWKPSTPPGYTLVEAMAGLMLGALKFYFKRVVRKERGWWIFKRRCWVETGEVWEPKSGEFTVVDAKQVEVTSDVASKLLQSIGVSNEIEARI